MWRWLHKAAREIKLHPRKFFNPWHTKTIGHPNRGHLVALAASRKMLDFTWKKIRVLSLLRKNNLQGSEPTQARATASLSQECEWSSVTEGPDVLHTHGFPPEHTARLHFPATLASRCGFMTEIWPAAGGGHTLYLL